jgi:hypothetical protein
MIKKQNKREFNRFDKNRRKFYVRKAKEKFRSTFFEK